MCYRFATASLLVSCSTTEQPLAPVVSVVCQQYFSSRDIEELRAIVESRSEIPKPVWEINCDDRHHAVVASSPNNDRDISHYVTLARRHGKWHIVSLKKGVVVVVTG